MKYIDKYKDLKLNSEDDVFKYIISNLKDTIRSYDFFVDWDKAIEKTEKLEVSLNILNSLIGKTDLKNKLKLLIVEYPKIVSAIPALIAVRDENIKIADLNSDVIYSFMSKDSYTDDEIEDIGYFCEKCGLLKIFSDRRVKNLVDYVFGVEVGLDTNARKNRSGESMESLVEIYVKNICKKNNFRYLSQATVTNIKKEFGKEVNTDKSDRHFDFAIDVGEKIYILEVNYYGSGGSKLKSVSGEFRNLCKFLENEKTTFIWITDGLGWRTAEKPLLETFNSIDYIMNINMLKDGFLEEILTKGL